MGGGGAGLDGIGGPPKSASSLVKSKSGGILGLRGIGGGAANPRPAGNWTVSFPNGGDKLESLESVLGGGGGGPMGQGILGGAKGGLELGSEGQITP